MDRGAWQAIVHGNHKESDLTERLSLTHSLTPQGLFVAVCLLIPLVTWIDYFGISPLCEASDVLLRGCSPGYMHNNSKMAGVIAELSETVSFPELSVKLACLCWHHTQLLGSTNCQLIALFVAVGHTLL